MNQRTVLVVEDEPRVAEAIADQLREEEYDVIVARTMTEAELALTMRGPEVVVLDVVLPDGSGLELCHKIRCGGRPWDPRTGIILLTARVEEADVLRGFLRG